MPRTKYVIKNTTHYPQREVRRLVEFAGRELPSLGPVVVEVKYSNARGGGPHGVAHHGRRVTIWLPHPKNPWAAPSWKHYLLSITAHELRHAYDYREYGGRDAWYGEITGKNKRGRTKRDVSVGRERENRARAFADYVVEQWKKLHPDKSLTSKREELAILTA